MDQSDNILYQVCLKEAVNVAASRGIITDSKTAGEAIDKIVDIAEYMAHKSKEKIIILKQK